jgi:hypothetical protein
MVLLDYNSTKKYFIMPKESTPRNQPENEVNKEAIEQIIQDFLTYSFVQHPDLVYKILKSYGEDNLKKVYRAVIFGIHPDRNKDNDIATKNSEILITVYNDIIKGNTSQYEQLQNPTQKRHQAKSEPKTDTKAKPQKQNISYQTPEQQAKTRRREEINQEYTNEVNLINSNYTKKLESIENEYNEIVKNLITTYPSIIQRSGLVNNALNEKISKQGKAYEKKLELLDKAIQKKKNAEVNNYQ